MKRASGLAAHYVALLKGLEQEKVRIEEEIRQIRALLVRHTSAGTAAEAPVSVSVKERKPRKKRELSAGARAKIAAAQKKRWAEFRKKPKGS